MNLFYLWIPVILVINIASAKLSLMNQTGSVSAAWGLWMVGAIPLWVFVSKFSKNMLFDAMLYDSLMVVSFALAVSYFSGAHLSWINYVGIILIGMAMILIKM